MSNTELGGKPSEITWQELKDFVNSIPEKHLQGKVMTAYGDEGYSKLMNEPGFIENDIYFNKEDPEDSGTIEEIKMNLEMNDEVFDIENYSLWQEAGTPFLWID
jgi:hypothetical protein